MFFSSWIVQLLGVLGGIAVIVVFVIGVYFCYNKCSLNPTPGIVVTVTGNDTRTIVTSGMWKKYSTNTRRVCKCLMNAARNRREKVNINLGINLNNWGNYDITFSLFTLLYLCAHLIKMVHNWVLISFLIV